MFLPIVVVLRLHFLPVLLSWRLTMVCKEKWKDFFQAQEEYNVLVHLLLFLVLLTCFPSFSSTQSPLDPCSMVQCGQGSCNVSNSFPFFECECHPGWIKPQFLTIDLPFCIIPNCNVSMECGDTNHPSPREPITLPPLNITDPCFLVWCGEGRCVRDGVGHNHTCKCNDGSKNLLSNKGLPCLKECSLGADCKGVSLGRPQSPRTSSAHSNFGKGWGSVQRYSRDYGTFFLVAAIVFVWI